MAKTPGGPPEVWSGMSRRLRCYARAKGYNGIRRQEALRAVLNVVVEVNACGNPISDQAGRIAEKMAANVTEQAH